MTVTHHVRSLIPPEDRYPHGTLSRYTEVHCRCDECREAKNRWQRAYRSKNKERCAASDHAFYVANKEKYLERHRRYRAANPNAEVEYTRAYWQRESTKERQGLLAAARRAAHPEQARLIVARRRARQLAAETFLVTERDWTRLVARYRDRCAYCGLRRKLTADHVIPLSRGGRHSIGNIVPACRSCNSKKKTRLLVEWRANRRVPLTVLTRVAA